MLICSGIFIVAAAEKGGPADTSAYETFLKSYGLTEAEFQSRVGSTNMFGGSSPVSFSGEGRIKLQYHSLKTDQQWMRSDRSYIQSGWEGNESLIRMGMVARAGRNTILYSKIGFQHTMPGNRWIQGDSTGAKQQTRHDKSLVIANIHEDMSAGIAIRTVPASFWLNMGAINWVEASPFTIWKSQPRTFAWEYLPYEIEQPIARYYEYNIANGEKAGRAAWHKKPLNGICLESISLPANLYLDLTWCTYERYDNYEREFIDVAGDLSYTEAFPLKATGIGDSYRHLFHARLAKMKMIGDLTFAANFNRYDVNDDIFSCQDGSADRFLKTFNMQGSLTNPLNINGRGFYKEPLVVSLDLRGPFAKGLFDIHSDIAVSRIDTTFLIWKTSDTLNAGTAQQTIVPDSSTRFEKLTSSSPFTPAFFTKLVVNTVLPFQVDIAVIDKGFYSPLSFVAPNDAFYAFGSNLVGSGKFLARHEASPYVQNMAGILLSAMPKIPGYGHFRIAYGQHMQLKPGRDILYIPYRLNGLDFFSLSHSTYNRWGQGQVDFPLAGDYYHRLGDESYTSQAYQNPTGLEGGGLYTDYLSTMECFVPYPDKTTAMRNHATQSGIISQERTYRDATDTVTSATAFVPVNRKYTNNFEIDIAYDISDLIGYPNNLFLGGYAAVNNVSTAFSALAVGDKADNVQLWSMYLRFEPAIALTKKFYLLGILGYENWRSQKSWMNITDAAIVNKYLTPADSAAFAAGEKDFNVPIDFRDAAVGLGFDWDILGRVGLHARAKYMFHKDVNFTRNNWSTPIVSLEIKTWF